MNTRSTIHHTLTLALLSLALAWGGTVSAQSDLDTRELADPKTRVQSCNQVDLAWNLQLIEQYPRIADACHEVVVNNNTKWARFEANFLRINADGSVTSEFIGPTGRKMGRYTLIPGPDQQVTLDGRKQPFSALTANQRINLYVPEGATELTSEPMTAPRQQSRIVRYEPIYDDATRQDTRQADAIASTSSDQRMTRLPSTAGALPWFAFGGLLAAFAGLALRIARRS